MLLPHFNSNILCRSVASIPKLPRGDDLLPAADRRQISSSSRNSIGTRQLNTGLHLEPSVTSISENEEITGIDPRLPQNPRTATWRTGSPSAKRSSIGGSTKVTDVCGFSADVAWTPSFVLAPSKVMQAQHAAHEQLETNQSGYSLDESAQRWWKWDNITKAPVIMHPSMDTHVQITQKVAAETDGDVTTVPSDHLQNADEEGRKEYVQNSTDIDPNPATSLSHSPSLKPSKETPLEAARQLMLEMGTVRNSRRKFTTQHSLNVWVPGSSRGSGLRLSSLLRGDEKNDLGESLLTSKQKQIDNVHKFSWSTYVERFKEDNGSVDICINPSEREDTVFLTSMGDEEEERSKKNICDGIRRGVVSEETQSDKPEIHSTIVPTSLVLRDTLHYPKVYSAAKMIERGDHSSTGSRISSSWHPRYDKVMFILGKGTLEEVSLSSLNKKQSRKVESERNSNSGTARKRGDNNVKSLARAKKAQVLKEIQMPHTVRDGRGSIMPEPIQADVYCQRSYRESARSNSSPKLQKIQSNHSRITRRGMADVSTNKLFSSQSLPVRSFHPMCLSFNDDSRKQESDIITIGGESMISDASLSAPWRKRTLLAAPSPAPCSLDMNDSTDIIMTPLSSLPDENHGKKGGDYVEVPTVGDIESDIDDDIDLKSLGGLTPRALTPSDNFITGVDAVGSSTYEHVPLLLTNKEQLREAKARLVGRSTENFEHLYPNKSKNIRKNNGNARSATANALYKFDKTSSTPQLELLKPLVASTKPNASFKQTIYTK